MNQYEETIQKIHDDPVLDALNTPEEVGLRRYRSRLSLDGIGYITFGIWSVVKIIASLFLSTEFYTKMIGYMQTEDEPEELVKLVFGVFIAIVCIMTLLVHFKIGVAAIRYSNGTRKTRGFLFLVLIMIVLTAHGLSTYFTQHDYDIKFLDDTAVASAIADLTGIFILIDMVISASRIKRFRRLQREAKQED
ncbi:MAG: hypothetical protein J5518_04580 [Lachnospiraceae bacterium]|nr:hypothetical protein [Lachnospiraceae bacterium]